LVCKLPLIPIARPEPPLSGESVPPGCRPPTPGSHIHFPKLCWSFRGVCHFPTRHVPRLGYEPHSIAFSRYSRLESGCLLGLQATPVPFQASNSAPWPPSYPAPGSHSFLAGLKQLSSSTFLESLQLRFLLAVPAALWAICDSFNVATRRHPLVCMLPLRVTPLSARPDRLPSCVRIPDPRLPRGAIWSDSRQSIRLTRLFQPSCALASSRSASGLARGFSSFELLDLLWSASNPCFFAQQCATNNAL
jgi:hypothetical protein